ncbi:MAG TPA: D-Ala-D-Ala carboxypeptidase family metallohydrolase [Hyphomicrobiaceae bacterium]|nr:D-Ala-D-Ala carboxypeptidase family metallohydrolase [Hyphomicrobiaceae bacterium]
MVFELLRTTSGGSARRLLAALAVAFTVHMPFAAPALADPTDWARAVINEAKASQDSVERESRRVRVASLGNEGFEAVARPRRTTTERIVSVPSEVTTVRPAAKPKRVASLGSSRSDVSTSERSRREQRVERRSLSGGSVNWIASAGCLDGSLRSVVNAVASRFGPVTVNSTCRSRGHNRRVGGASQSKHLTGDAVDFRIHGNVSATYAYLRSSGSVGGLKHYGGGLFHIDTGPRRSW